ncbi:MAG: MotA/TolQ/ExbB proton channel family protein [Pseudomonadota bacterium]
MSLAYLLLLRYMILNIAALAILGFLWMEGWITQMLEQDVTRITQIIIGVFIFGWVICSYKVFRCSQELNAVSQPDDYGPSRAAWYLENAAKTRGDSRVAIAECLRSRLYSRISVIRTVANNLIILGLIGTVIGFIISLSGVEAERVADVASVAPMVSTLIQGMSVALYTTLVGAVLHVWLTMCYQVLATGTVNLVNAIIERSEVPDSPHAVDVI